MGLKDLVARLAVRRCHVLVVEMPGGTLVRMEVERELARRGWVEALSPADADILCSCGVASPGFSDPMERVWEQLPGPRARTSITTVDDVHEALTLCADELSEPEAQAAAASERHHKAAKPEPGTDHNSMNHGDMDHGSMDHGDMDMPMPDGIALAGQGEDRDGLDLDELHLPLGPVLPLWPAGLVLGCTIQGDIVTTAKAELLAGPGQPEPASSDARAAVVHQTDLAARLLRLGASQSAAERMLGIRNAALAGAALNECRDLLTVELSRLKKSYLLRRSLSGVGAVDADSLNPEAGTDAWDRLVGMLENAARAADGQPRAGGPQLSWPVHAAQLEELVAGQELGRVRLIVASLDLTPARALEVVSP